ncbi:isoprenoid synthase domain-containing protein [Aspergillus carlsbadensis]|nr:isoprenoid synthase domain-containing protein [Aspergillus carlsbadensis]
MVNCLAPMIAGYHYWSCVCFRYHSSQNPSASPGLDNSREDACTLPYVSPSALAKQLGPTALNGESTPASRAALHRAPLEAPINYVQSLSSKNVRSQLIDALNLWFGLSSPALATVKQIVNDLHNSSLILDDIQDGSLLRRGGTAAHLIFGKAQSINSATYMFVRAAKQVHALSNPSLMTVLLDELDTLFLGQSWELRWRFTSQCPTEEEYFAMVDCKTGAMFHMLIRLMLALVLCEEDLSRSTRFDVLAQRLGRWYPIRDDYLNLQEDGEYGKKKAFCEDLDEGKFSYLVVRCCADPVNKDIVTGILHRRDAQEVTRLPLESKMQILGIMEKAGVMHETWNLIMRLQREVEEEITSLEGVLGETNPMLRVLVKLLGHIPEPSKQL